MNAYRTIGIALGNTAGAVLVAQATLVQVPGLDPLLVCGGTLLFFIGLTIVWCWPQERERS